MSSSSQALEYYNKFNQKLKEMVGKYPYHIRDDLMQEAYLGIRRACQKNTNTTGELPYKYMMSFVSHYITDYYHKNRKPVTVSRRVKHEDFTIEDESALNDELEE